MHFWLVSVEPLLLLVDEMARLKLERSKLIVEGVQQELL